MLTSTLVLEMMPETMPTSAAAAESTTWRPLEVPGCWEAQGFPILQDELWYRARVHLDSAGHRDFDPAWHRIWLHFEGVSHSCSVEVNGIQVGEHAGIWTPFAFDVTDAVLKRSDRGAGTNTADILVKVRKPVERDAIRGALAGFLPYVWGHVFGGIWQPVTLRTTGPAVIDGVWIRGWVDGRVRVRTEVQVHKSRPGTDLDEWRLDWLVKDVSGEIVAQGNTACRRGSGTQGTQGTQLVEWEFELPDPKPWSLRSPHLYTMEILYTSLYTRSKPGSQPAGTAPAK